MNQIEKLRNDLLKRFPDLDNEMDPSETETGPWFLNLRPGGSPEIVVEWGQGRGFGISTPDEWDYGTKPDEIVPDVGSAFDRVVELIESGGRTEPPRGEELAELRRAFHLTQAQLAERVGIKQAALSRIEGRGDILLSTLQRVIGALGGKVTILVDFPDGTRRELATPK